MISTITLGAESEPFLLTHDSAGAAGNFLASINQLSSNAFKSVIDIDVLGSYNTLKATIPHLIESATNHKSDGKTCELALSLPQVPPDTLPACPSGTGGRIIFVSVTLHYAGVPLQSHVCVAKAGVDTLSNVAALEYGPRGVTSNVIAPGPIADTDGMERLSRPEDREAGMKTVPLGRWGRVKEIADATVYLFSDAANFVTGQTLVGGFFYLLSQNSMDLEKLICRCDLVDGGAWRIASSSPGMAFQYPDFLLSGEAVSGVKSGRSKL